ncbi:MAG: Stp1/IreP family PP2C-type Ser/Thr phosphatase [Candidatus Aminicenantes bacterium]|nr:Stp1/IreP family PP2C-type Ser/Thr phosphatase [Candidatus Aminicenantes bacterium]
MKISFFGLTDVGRKRKFNEDNFDCLELPERPGERKNSASLLIVADGIGGHAGGDTASKVGVDVFRDQILERFKSLDYDIRHYQETMQNGIQTSNREIFQMAAENTNLTGMGTTMVTALTVDNYALVSNVGDSRAYLIREGRITQISEDHSWKAEQRKLNLLTEEEIVESPFRHTITRSLGFESDVKVDTFLVDMHRDDYLLLCTDGLYESLPDEYMCRIIIKNKKPDKICHRLIKLANKNGGHDNITAVIAHVLEVPALAQSKESPADTVKLDIKLKETDEKQPVPDTIDLGELDRERKPSPSDTVKLG